MVYAGNRKLANAWCHRYFVACATREESPQLDLVREALAGYEADPDALLDERIRRAASEELGFARGEVVPVRTDIAVAAYNIDTLWAKIIELMPQAQRARLLRILTDVKSESGWSALWSHAVNAGRVLRSTLTSRGERAGS